MNIKNSDTRPGTPSFRKYNIFLRFLIWFKKNWIRIWQRLYPDADFRRGASIGVIALTGIIAISFGIFFRPGFWFIFDIIAGILISLLAALLLGIVSGIVLKIVSLIPRFINWKGLMAVASLIVILIILKFPIHLAVLIGIGLGAIEAILGGSIGFILGQEFRHASWIKKGITVLAILATIAVNIHVILWLMDKGNDTHLIIPTKNSKKTAYVLNAPNPAQKGSHIILKMTYGSGTDSRRPEFGKKTNLRTRAVDATPFLKENKNWTNKLREWYWGFDFKKFPLNGRVWYPGGEGPFPLVLIVHGNHTMEEFSDPGYIYLGELLSSRGFITVSVDENFFNGSWASSLKKENDGRAWLLLEHLKIWKEWNETKESPFYGKVDLENIGLVGHSRGGEAVAIAALFNRLPRYPDDATVSFAFNFNIKSIVSIAPSDGQYKPAGKPTPLKNVNYLLLQGGHDADAFIFMGARQYKRLVFNDGKYRFKAILYSYRSNHGQFNTVWGKNDYGLPLSLLLNKKPFLTGEAQRKISSVYISAFFESTLHGKKDYIPLFRDHRLLSKWIPDDIYITRFEDSTFQVISNFEEDVDVTTTTLADAKIIGSHLAVWKEADLPLRKYGTKGNNVVYIGWRKKANSKENATYSIEFPENFNANKPITQESLLVFSMADTGEDPPETEGEEKKGKNQTHKNPVDLSIELIDIKGQTSKLPLSQFMLVSKVLKSRFTKLMNERSIYGKDFEPTLQTFELPISAFLSQSQNFDLTALKTIRFIFDQRLSGIIILDDIGFAQPVPAE